jgi:3-phosphoshikimate 1-carboxyvinyltransferase
MNVKSGYIEIRKLPEIPPCTISIPSSKSESNRALIIHALAKKGKINNLSTARDTQTMLKLLQSNEQTLDVLDAGTTMRFLTAYFAISDQDRILTGTKRMCERPIGILVDALRELGADIEYIDTAGYPPLHIKGFQDSGIKTIRMRGDVSSQYISAILMISPILKNGLKLELTGKVSSRPYIDMTLGIMRHFGVSSKFKKNIIKIPKQPYVNTSFDVDPDWSGASYWYSIAALAREASILLKGFHMPSYQGDSIIRDLMTDLGVKSTFNNEGIHLTKCSHVDSIEIDFSNFPDLAQTVAVVCSCKGIYARFTGLESLRIKETDRIAALQNELSKLGGQLTEKNGYEWELVPATGSIRAENLIINTYDDHRMAMAFAPIAAITNVKIENPDVVQKSYPSFWDDINKAGFPTEYIPS